MTRIARTVAEANLGDLLWHKPDIWRPVPWELLPVRKLGRVNIFVGAGEGEHTWRRFRLDRLNTNNSSLAGSREREVIYWTSRAREIADMIKKSKDIDMLRDVAFVLDLPKAPDFSDPSAAG